MPQLCGSVASLLTLQLCGGNCGRRSAVVSGSYRRRRSSWQWSLLSIDAARCGRRCRRRWPVEVAAGFVDAAGLWKPLLVDAALCGRCCLHKFEHASKTSFSACLTGLLPVVLGGHVRWCLNSVSVQNWRLLKLAPG